MPLAGAFRHRVRLENPGPFVPDGDGGSIPSWVPLSPSHMWASIRPASAADLERVFAGTVVETAMFIVTMRFHPGVGVDTQLVRHTGKRYAVNAVRNLDERDAFLELVCAEVTLDGAGTSPSGVLGTGRTPAGTPGTAGSVND